MASGHEMRVGDAEREASAAELREHYASGRLTLDELNERLDKAFAARTRGDLDGLMRDLPSARPYAGGAAGAGLPGAGPTGAGWGQGSGSGQEPGWRQSEWSGGRGSGWTGGAGRGTSAGRQAGRALGAIVTMSVLIGALILVGTLGAFGIGAGRPGGILLLVLALGLLRRLLFGRRRRFVRGCGPRRRR